MFDSISISPIKVWYAELIKQLLIQKNHFFIIFQYKNVN